MGSYNFRWEHPAQDVHVTGTFDNWTKSVELEKSNSVFEKLVSLPQTTEKILYKFVVDGVWCHDITQKSETDHEGNVNNVLYPDDIGPLLPMAHTTSSVAPGATTTELAGAVPLEKQPSTPGAFPETPAADLSSNDAEKDGLSNAGANASETLADAGKAAGETLSNAGAAAAAGVGSAVAAGAAALGYATSDSANNGQEDSVFSVKPIPASEGTGNPMKLAAGDKVPEASTINSNTVASTVREDPELVANDSEKAYGVAPIPATGGIGNPISLAAGEKVPETSTISQSTIDSHVKLDKESYQKSDSAASVLPALAPILTPQGERQSASAAIFNGLGPQTTNMIPESSMGMGADVPPLFNGAGATISSVGATSTTNELAGKQPIEPRGVPTVVTDSQREAHVDPEAFASPDAVKEKKEVENELKSKVPEEKASTDVNSTEGVPSVVADSQHKAHADPEASASPRAVQEKNEVESELKSKVREAGAGTASANGGISTGGVTAAVTGGLATAGAAAAGATLALNQKAKETTGTDAVAALPKSVQDSIHHANKTSTTKSALTNEASSAVPSEVKESQREAHSAPEASANPEAVTEKSAVEKELLAKVPVAKESGKPAPTATAATSTTAPVAVPVIATARPPTSSSGAPQLADPLGAGLAPISMDDKPGLNAPASSPAQVGGSSPSRDVSPMTKPSTEPSTTKQTAPVVTSGITSSEIPAVSSSPPIGTPRKTQATPSTPTKRNSSMIDRLKGGSNPGTPESKAGSEKKEKKSFFSKIKEKLKN